jgi:hypothetical protein
MILRYDLIDLNTAVKPFYFRHIFQRYAGEKDLEICYLDPDISVYANLSPIKEALARAAVLLTPHVLSAIANDGKKPKDQSFLAFGLYNLGFIAMRRSEAADKLLEWWSGHLVEDCRYDPVNGLFVDQAWMDLAPIFFENVEISRHPGLNVAYWNLHERKLEFRDGAWWINSKWPLVFYHFSDLPLEDSEAITKTPSRFTLRDRPDLKPLLDKYRSQLATHDNQRFNRIPCAYVERRTHWLRQQRQIYYRRHPIQLLIAALKRALPKQLKTFVRSS